MTSREIAEELASYARQLDLDDVDDETASAAKTRIVDSLASGLGALHVAEPAVERVVQFAAGREGRGDARIVGTDETAPVEYAGLANATLIRYLDWNDYHAEENVHGNLSIGHASSNLGALLAVADAHDCSGDDLLLATVLAYELHMRMADQATLYDDGLDHVNYGLVSSTLAAGKLLGLSEAELAQAVNIAVSSHVALWQTRCGELTEWKGIAFGNTVRNALVAVDMARSGIHGPARIFEGEAGFSNLLSHPIDFDYDAFGANGGEFRIHGTNIKQYPVCGALQEPLECVFELLDRHEFGWEEVTGVDVTLRSEAVGLTAAEDEKWDPQTRNTADHSLPYCVARALVDREMGPRQFTEEKITDPVVRELFDRIGVTEHPERKAVSVETETGSFEESIEYPRGHHERPFTDEDLARKLRTAVGAPAGDETVDDIVAWTDDLERHSSVSKLFDLASAV